MCNKGVPLYEIVKGINCLLNFCFHMLVAEYINFYAHVGIALYTYITSSNGVISF